MAKNKRKLEMKLDRRLRGYDSLVANSKAGGKEYTKPGSRNPKKR